MSHPIQTARADVTALALVVVVWSAPFAVVQEGYDKPMVGVFYLFACAAICWLIHLHVMCGDIVRPVITLTVCVVAFISVAACLAAMALAIPAIITLASSGGIFHPGGDGGTLWLIYIIPTALLIIPITKFMA